MVMKMKWVGYALQNGFSEYLFKHPDLLEHLSSLSQEQCQQLVLPLDEEELQLRAMTYFNNEQIVLHNHKLSFEHPLRKKTYAITIEPYAVLLDQKEENPFYPFLQRVFRKFLVFEVKECR